LPLQSAAGAHLEYGFIGLTDRPFERRGSPLAVKHVAEGASHRGLQLAEKIPRTGTGPLASGPISARRDPVPPALSA